MEGLESFFTSGQQLRLFLLSCAFGIPIGIAFDIFRVIRMLVRHNKIAAALEDILFFCLYGVFLMCFTITAARSEFRFFYCLGNFLGFVVYYVTAGTVVTNILKKIIFLIKKLLSKLLEPVLKKFVLLYEKIRSIFVGTLQNMKSSKKNSKTPLIDDSDLLYNNRSRKIKKNKRKNVKKIGSKSSQEKKEKRHV